ncbi:DNA polymerase III subunit gamma/tau [Microbacterium thalli]|uniref:DNA polymerase III subunit gamma/tau n=1 Tax=Microbacterium thalli TaxID=3027921 RepID=A0ABT5SIK1_9MICO|nr:DNA polymerase III subunit gamma/tau [Microbacterium thalli]MDD7962654.1 DNA polymerase III subunit gamma/tau [Microbacterium thalli]MDN8547695.1 DNA polymerase III subunit gamma/tau [Microbacterium thalli]
MTTRDDDALSWAGDDDPTLVSAPPADEPAAPRRSNADVSAITTTPAAASVPSGNASEPDDTDGDRAAGMSSAALVSLGVLGGIYLLYTIGWIVGGLRMNGVVGFLVAPPSFVPAAIVAVLAPAIWFGVAFLLTRERPSWQRFAWLAAGVVLLVPWPFVMIGTGL